MKNSIAGTVFLIALTSIPLNANLVPWFDASASVRVGAGPNGCIASQGGYPFNHTAAQAHCGITNANIPGTYGVLTQAVANWGTLGVGYTINFDEYTVPPKPGINPPQFVVDAVAQAEMYDYLTFSAGSAAKFTFQISGSGGQRNYLYVGGYEKLFNGPTTISFTIGVTPGIPENVIFLLDSDATFALPWGQTGVTGSSSSDYLDTAQLISTQIVDAAGNPVDAVITAASGFDYLHPLAKVPEPGTLGMVLVAGLFLLLKCRRKQVLTPPPAPASSPPRSEL